MFMPKTALTTELKKKDVKLVTPELFFDCWERKGLLPKCQEVPPQFFVDVDALTDEEHGTLEVVAISYCWIAQEHPDPRMYHLETLYHLLRKFVVGTFDATRQYTANSSIFNLNGNEVCGSGDGRRLGIFLDWLSVPQEARSYEDTAVFKRALGSINLWYAHPSTTTWMLTSLPPPDFTRNCHVASHLCYEERGWTTFERHVASLISPSTQVLHIDVGVREKLSRDDLQCDYYQLCLDTMERSRGAPVEPAAFTRDVRAKHFTNGADFYDVVVPRYKDTFFSVMEEATAINYRGQGVSDGAFWDIMAAFHTYGKRELIELIDFSFSELSVSLEELATSAHCFNLRKLILEGSKNVGGGLSNITKLQNLKELFIWGTKVEGKTEDLSKLQHLTDLEFGNTNVEGSTRDLSKLQHLTKLAFGNTMVKGRTEDLSKLQHLTELYFFDTKVKGRTKYLSKLQHLTTLAFGNTMVKGRTEDLSKLQHLTELYFFNTKVKGRTEDLSKLQHLTTLAFDNTKVEGKTEDLSKLQHLKKLYFFNTKVEGRTKD